KPGIAAPETVDFFEKKKLSQMYSRAVQVFACLAVEAFVNAYGYLRLGEEHFEQTFKKKRVGISKKLNSILSEVMEDVDNNPEIDLILRKLADRRNRIVHPKPEMKVLLEDGTKRETTKRLAPVDPKSATAALEEMERFFKLFSAIDPEAAFVLGCAPYQHPKSEDSFH
ncbi:MAG TPA: hypothetical protein VK210_03895, partial [Terriglobia bacterium]|nr:hypothetical protein [Terriglobia bacterium]